MSLAYDLAIAGYIECPCCLPPELVARARAAVEDVVARGAPAVVACALDPLWEIVELAVPYAERALAAPVAILPAFWAWHLGTEPAGWSVHRDSPALAFTDTGAPATMTLWIALSDATPRNGCIYVVPAPWDLQYRNPQATSHILSLQHVLALPAPAGTVLGWTHALLHWGGMAIPGSPPRISMSFELCRADQAPPEAHPSSWKPTQRERAELIARMIERYQHMHHYPPEKQAVAQAYLRELASA